MSYVNRWETGKRNSYRNGRTSEFRASPSYSE